MAGAVYIRTYRTPRWNRGEILRYAGAKETSEELNALLESCLAEAEGKLSYQVCWAGFPVREEDGVLDLGFARTESANLRKNLNGCGAVVVFGATVGLELDRLIARHSRISPARALLFQAIGAERIEALCDCFNEEIRAEACAQGKSTRPRFSPGYGDLPLDLQRDIFRALDCPRRIGLTLNDSLLMTPTKSVTALIGIGANAEETEKSACGACDKASYLYRRNI